MPASATTLRNTLTPFVYQRPDITQQPCITPGEASRVTILLDLNVLACDFDGRLYLEKQNQTLTLALAVESDAMRYDGFGERNTRIITLEKPPQRHAAPTEVGRQLSQGLYVNV